MPTTDETPPRAGRNPEAHATGGLARVYVETSAVNAAAAAGWSGAALRVRLAELGYRPITGHLTVHELARVVVAGDLALASRLFGLLRGLDPEYHQPPDELVTLERRRLRSGQVVDPALDPANLRFTRSEVERLAEGRMSRELRVLIEDRDRDKRTDFRSSTRAYLEHVDALRRNDPASVPEFRTYEEVLDHFRGELPRLIAVLVDRDEAGDTPVGPNEARALAARLDDCPALRTQVRLWLYMVFVACRNRVVPGIDKLDDYRHVVEAAYCDALVTHDGQLARTVPRLNAELTVIVWPVVAGAGPPPVGPAPGPNPSAAR